MKVELAAVELMRQADLEDIRHELAAAKDMLRKLDALDAFARTDRDGQRPLN